MSGFKLDPKFASALIQSKPVVDVLGDKAAQVAATARDFGAEHGSYPDTIESDVGENAEGDVVGRAFSTHEAAAFLEFGTVHARKFAPLRRALDSLEGQ